MSVVAPRALTQRDFDRVARLSGDRNPVHVDPEFARASALGATVAQGMLLYGLVQAALSRRVAARLPRGWLPLSQTLAFPAPTYVGDAVAVDAAPIAGALRFSTRVRNQHGATTADGESSLVDAAAGYPPRPIDDSFAHGDLESDAELLGTTLGESASVARVFVDADLDEYLDLADDRNPVVRDAGAARAVGLPARALPAPLLAGMFQDLLGSRLPGHGSGWIRQRIAFHSAAHVGEPLTATVTVTRLRRDRQLATLACVISADDGRSVATGEALVTVRPAGR